MEKFIDTVFYKIHNKIKSIHRFFKFGYLAYKHESMVWDYHGSLELFKEALLYLEPAIRNGYGANRLKTCEKIKTICHLIDRLNKNVDIEKGTDLLNKQYGEPVIEFVDSDRPGFSCMVDNNPNRQSPEFKGIYRRMIKNDMNSEELEYQYMMKLLTRNLRKFWD